MTSTVETEPAETSQKPPPSHAVRRGVVLAVAGVLLALLGIAVLVSPLGYGTKPAAPVAAPTHQPAPASTFDVTEATRAWWVRVAEPDLGLVRGYLVSYRNASGVGDVKGMAQNCSLLAWQYQTMAAEDKAPDAQVANHWSSVIALGNTFATQCVRATQGKTKDTIDADRMSVATGALNQQTPELIALGARLDALGVKRG
jgi:hypothetical protein